MEEAKGGVEELDRLPFTMHTAIIRLMETSHRRPAMQLRLDKAEAVNCVQRLKDLLCSF